MRLELNWSPPEGDANPRNPLADPYAWIREWTSTFRPRVDASSPDGIHRWRERNSRSRVATAFRETPSWLASVVFHALAMVILGSLAGSQIRAARAPITLTLAASKHHGQEIEFTSPAIEPSPEKVAQSEPESSSTPEKVDLDSTEDAVVNNVLENVELPPQDLLVQPESNEEQIQFASTSIPQFERSPFDIPQNEPRPYGRRSHAGRSPRTFDQIVDEFIEFDLGRLNADAGHRANAAFRQLGPEAIPALVRGLNKSAYISASCPVGVISSKLVSAARDSQDPEMIQYALANLGKGVKPNASHYRRLERVRRRLMSLTTDEGQKELQRLAKQRTEANRKKLQRAIQERARTAQKREQRGRDDGFGPDELVLSRRPRSVQRVSPQNILAERMLQSASRLHRSRQYQAARQLLSQIARRYPETREAKIAREYLKR